MLTLSHPSSASALFQANAFALDGNNEPLVWESERLSAGCALRVKVLQIADISAFSAELDCPQKTRLTVALDEPALRMCFTLSGQLNVYGEDGSAVMKQQTHFAFLVPGNSGVALDVSGGAKLFVVCFYGEALPKLFSEEERGYIQGKLAGNTWRSGRPATFAMHQIIDAVMRCADNNCLHQIFMAAKMLELLFISLDQLKQQTSIVNTPSIKPNDLEKLELAKLIIEDNLKQPYPLVVLAHKVGLNDFKLKKGFKEAFGNTVFGYLLDMRMVKARAMLLSGRHKVSEVASEIGYKNAHHFSVAFKKKFGYLPSKINAGA
jgi:AraC-like DNA-binding protein